MSPHMNPKIKLNIVVGIICGFCVWFLSGLIIGANEPWDGEGLFFLYYPVALFISGVFSALPAPKLFLYGCVGVYIGQAVHVLSFHEAGPLWLIGAIYGLVFLLVSILGGIIVYALSRHKNI